MTGFGKAELISPGKKISVEIKALNSRQLDISTRIPVALREKDMDIRNELTNALQRGKIDLFLTIEKTDEIPDHQINTELVKTYYNQLARIASDLDIETSERLIQVVMRLPDVMKIDKEIIAEEEWEIILGMVKKAIKELKTFRDQEGKTLQKDIVQRIKNIQKKLSDIGPFEKKRIETIRQKILSGLKDLKLDDSIDGNRFEQELIFYLEKIDITEEKVRLENHCNFFLETVESNEPPGKKLGFIAQEIGREINTIGSKANNSNIQRIVVEMKDELEKVKEQVLNIL